jgi:hypothetical protein
MKSTQTDSVITNGRGPGRLSPISTGYRRNSCRLFPKRTTQKNQDELIASCTKKVHRRWRLFAIVVVEQDLGVGLERDQALLKAFEGLVGSQLFQELGEVIKFKLFSSNAFIPRFIKEYLILVTVLIFL